MPLLLLISCPFILYSAFAPRQCRPTPLGYLLKRTLPLLIHPVQLPAFSLLHLYPGHLHLFDLGSRFQAIVATDLSSFCSVQFGFRCDFMRNGVGNIIREGQVVLGNLVGSLPFCTFECNFWNCEEGKRVQSTTFGKRSKPIMLESDSRGSRRRKSENTTGCNFITRHQVHLDIRYYSPRTLGNRHSLRLWRYLRGIASACTPVYKRVSRFVSDPSAPNGRRCTGRWAVENHHT